MTLADLTTACLSMAYDTEYGAEAATHTAASSGDDTACTVVRDESEGDEYRGGDDAFGSPSRIRVRASEITTVGVGDTFEIGTQTYEVLWARLSTDGTEWACECSLR